MKCTLKHGKIFMVGLLSFSLVCSAMQPWSLAKAQEEDAIDLTNGLAGHWEFDDIGNKTAANTGSYGDDWNGIIEAGNTVTIQNSEDVNHGGVLHFEPKENRTSKGMFISGKHKINTKKDNFTYSFWIKNKAGYESHTVILQQTGDAPTLLNLETGGKYAVYMSKENDKYITPKTNDNEWNLITLTKENNAENTFAVVKGYVNGRLAQTVTLELSKFIDEDSDLYVGRHKTADQKAGQFQGDMDDLRYYTRAISDTEVKAIYNLKGVAELTKELKIKIKEAKTLLKQQSLPSDHLAAKALQNALAAAEAALSSKDAISLQKASTDLIKNISAYQDTNLITQKDVDHGLIGHWTFDDANTPLKNEANEDYAAKKTGDVSVKDGVLHFDTNSTLSNLSISKKNGSGILNSAQDEFTVSLLLKRTNTKKMTLLQQTDKGRTLLYSKDNSYYTFINGTDYKIGTAGDVDHWEHLILVKSGSDPCTITTYINGEKNDAVKISGNLIDQTTKLLFGSHKSASDSLFHGDMDQIRIYNRAVSNEEANLLYSESSGVIEAQKIAAEKIKLNDVINKAQAEYDKNQLSDDETVRINLKQAIAQAREIYANATSFESLVQAREILSRALNDYSDATTEFNIQPDNVLRSIDRATFGINHRYGLNGYGTLDPSTMKVKDDFTKLYKKAGFGSIRYPGGGISNVFDWKTSIGPKEDRLKQINAYYKNKNALVPNFGLTEAGEFADETDSEIVYVYGTGKGDAKDAADLVEYLNAEVGDNPNGGTAWAEVRAKNGHPKPYNIRYFEIGNETQLGGEDGATSQQYWTAYVNGGAENAYTNGGKASFTKQYAVRKEDWKEASSHSDGSASQIFFMRYARMKEDKTANYKYYYQKDGASYDAVNKGSVSVFVNNEEWKLVTKDEMMTQSSTAKVAWIDYDDGSIHFGDGVHGMIPVKGEQVKVSYTVNRDGFVQMSQSIRDTMKQINEYNAAHQIENKELNVYSSFESHGFIERMNNQHMNELYDGLVIHPYSGTPNGSSNTLDSKQEFYWDSMKKGDSKGKFTKSFVDNMRKYDKTKVPVISEYGIFRSSDPLLLTQTHALYIARAIMDYVALGSPYIQKHCLVDWYTEGGSTQQGVIQAVPMETGNTATGEGEFKFFSTPSANVFEMLNGNFGNEMISSKITEKKITNDVNQYSVMTSKDEKGNVYAAIVNLNPELSNSIDIGIDGVDLTGKNVDIFQASGDTFFAENTLEHPDNVAVQHTEVTADGTKARVKLAPHSFTIVKIKNALINEKPTLDTGTLKSLIKECEALKEKDYTSKTWSVFAVSLQNAKEALTSDKQEKIDKAVLDLKEKKAGLKIVKSILNTSILETLIKECEVLKEKDYTAETWSAFAASLQNAKEALTSDTQEKIDKAVQDLKEKKAGLKTLKPDTSKLEEAIKNAITADHAAKYSESTWKNYQDALQNAKAIMANPSLTQHDIDNALQALRKAQNELKTRTVEVVKEKPIKQSNKSPVTGDTSNSFFMLCAFTLSGGGLILNIIRKRNTSCKESTRK